MTHTSLLSTLVLWPGLYLSFLSDCRAFVLFLHIFPAVTINREFEFLSY